MLKIIGIVVLVFAAAVVVLAATKPDSFRVQRSVSIAAPPEKIFAFIDDFHAWEAWSPYEKLDPDMKRTWGATTKGTGAVYAWDGNGKVGAGRMEITGSSPSTKVAIKLDFLKPFEAHNTAEFTLVPQGDATELTWTMDGPAPFVSKLMQVFFSMDKMIGKDFETGLANLKRRAEAPADA